MSDKKIILHYLTNDLFVKSQKLVENNSSFTIEVTNKKHIKSLNNILPYMIGIEKKRPTILRMIASAFKFDQIYAIVGLANEKKTYQISFTNDGSLFLCFQTEEK